MQIIEFDNLEFTTDKDKAIPKLEHDFRPYKDDYEVVIKCKYFQTGELSNYMDIKGGKRYTYRFRDIFRDQVKSISGLSYKDKKTGNTTPIEDADTFLKFPSIGVFDEILMSVALHLINADGLTGEEIKN